MNHNLSCFFSVATGTIEAPCNVPHVRWNASTPEGQNAPAIAQAAMLSGRKVTFRVESACVTVPSSSAKLAWIEYQ